MPNDKEYEAKIYDFCRQTFTRKGVNFETVSEQRNVLGIRTETPVTKANYHGSYDDYIWVVHIDKKGVKYSNGYNANTESNYRYVERGTDGADANKDGKRDIGRLTYGAYKYSTTMWYSSGVKQNVFKLESSQRIERDINKDGKFDSADEKLVTNKDAMMEGRTIHFHYGGENDTWSAGCQTMKKAVFQKFKEDIAKGKASNQEIFTYLLIQKYDGW